MMCPLIRANPLHHPFLNECMSAKVDKTFKEGAGVAMTFEAIFDKLQVHDFLRQFEMSLCFGNEFGEMKRVLGIGWEQDGLKELFNFRLSGKLFTKLVVVIHIGKHFSKVPLGVNRKIKKSFC